MPPTHLSRRRALLGLGGAAATSALAWPTGCAKPCPLTQGAVSGPPPPPNYFDGEFAATTGPGIACSPADFEALIVELIQVPLPELLELLVAHLGNGTEPSLLWRAGFQASTRTFGPASGGLLHTALSSNAARIVAGWNSSPDPLESLAWSWLVFKRAQAANSDYSVEFLPLEESALPSPVMAPEVFELGMDSLQPQTAELGLVALFREGGRDAVLEPLLRYAARSDDNQHKAIHTMHALRHLEDLGWDCAEPVLRTLALSLADVSVPEDLILFEANLLRADSVGPDWQDGTHEDTATRDLLALGREGSVDDLCDAAVEALAAGVAPSSLWTAALGLGVEVGFHAGTGNGVHTVDNTHALHVASRASADPTTQKLCLLQALAWASRIRPEPESLDDDLLDHAETFDGLEAVASSRPLEELLEIEDEHEPHCASRLERMRETLGYLDNADSPDEFTALARTIVTTKDAEFHTYKFHLAILEEAALAPTPAWRNRLLAAHTLQLADPSAPDREALADVRAALATLD